MKIPPRLVFTTAADTLNFYVGEQLLYTLQQIHLIGNGQKHTVTFREQHESKQNTEPLGLTHLMRALSIVWDGRQVFLVYK